MNNRVSTYSTSLDGIPNHPTGLDGNNNATRKPNIKNSSIFIGENVNTYDGISPKKLGNGSIKPSRPAPTSPAVDSPVLSANSSSPPLDYSMPLSGNSDSVSAERQEGSFFPHSGGEPVKSGGRFSNYEQSSPISPGFEGNPKVDMSSDFQSSVNNGIVRKESEFLLNHDASATHNKANDEREWKTPNQVRNRNKLFSKSADEIKEEEEQLVCFIFIFKKFFFVLQTLINIILNNNDINFIIANRPKIYRKSLVYQM